MGRRVQIVRLRWTDVDLDIAAIEWSVDWEARRDGAARRVVPTFAPLLARVKHRYMEQGRPNAEDLVYPPQEYIERASRLRLGWRAPAAQPDPPTARPRHAEAPRR